MEIASHGIRNQRIILFWFKNKNNILFTCGSKTEPAYFSAFERPNCIIVGQLCN